jgi:multiple antibiotic resistance protein
MRPVELAEMEQHLQAIITVLSLVNPLICGTLFARIESSQPTATRLADATLAAAAVLVILVTAALAGATVLQVFGVSLQAFSIAGGGVLTWMGFSMLRGSSSQLQDTEDRADRKQSLAPVILFAASPGTITGVITLAVVHSNRLPIEALVAVMIATAVMWTVMVLMARGETRASGGFVRDTTTRFMGLIIIAMGVQFALTGLRDFFGAH